MSKIQPLNEKLAEHNYLMSCRIEPGAFSQKRTVYFSAYNKQGQLTTEVFETDAAHVDETQGLCRADIINIDKDKAKVYLAGETYTIHKDTLIRNQAA